MSRVVVVVVVVVDLVVVVFVDVVVLFCNSIVHQSYFAQSRRSYCYNIGHYF